MNNAVLCAGLPTPHGKRPIGLPVRPGDLRRARLGKNRAASRGAAMLVMVVCLVVIASLGAGLMRSLVAGHRQGLLRRDQMQAFWLAESAVQRGAARLAAAPGYTGEDWRVEVAVDGRRVPAHATIRIEAVAGDAWARKIVAEARYPADGAGGVRQQRERLVTWEQPGAKP